VKLGTVDIGTNTTLLLVAEGTRPEDVRVLAERAEITRLGRGIGKDGQLQAEGVARTLDVLRRYAALARQHGAEIAAVGTEALRRAPNAETCLVPASEILGTNIQVIDGAREADLTFLAAIRSFPEIAASGPVVVLDIGGGSTEVIMAEPDHVRIKESLPLGSVRLTERHVRHDPPEDSEMIALGAEIEATLGTLALGRPAGQAPSLIGTAGTVTTLAAMSLGLERYDPALVHGLRLERSTLERQIARLRRSTQAEREAMAGLDPRRADVILAGACVLLAITRRLGVAEVLVNDRGIRWGLFYERLGAALES
jgi:exopolyphosphatase / guanosine-5'-triphosphate,3'-diphosphate pyrophosphatase